MFQNSNIDNAMKHDHMINTLTFYIMVNCDEHIQLFHVLSQLYAHVYARFIQIYTTLNSVTLGIRRVLPGQYLSEHNTLWRGSTSIFASDKYFFVRIRIKCKKRFNISTVSHFLSDSS